MRGRRGAPRRWPRRLGVAAAVVVAVGGLESIPGVPGHDQAALLSELAVSDAGAAQPFATRPPLQTCAGLESRFGVGNHLFKNTEFGMYASVWTTYQALTASYTASLARGSPTCSQDFAATVAAVDANDWGSPQAGFPPAFDQGPVAFHLASDVPRVDDSQWMGLANMLVWSTSRRPALLRRAEEVFTLAIRNWDPRGGGVYWEEHTPTARHQGRAVVSNGTAALLGAELYLATGRARYLGWSERITAWATRRLFDPAAGLYDDHVVGDRRGRTVDPVKLTYNQGIMIDALVALHLVAPAGHRLAAAVTLAERSMRYFALHKSYGEPAFDAVWAQSVLWLAGLDHDPAFTAAARRSVELALAAAPRRQPGNEKPLLVVSSEMTLRALTRLPVQDYGALVYPPLSRRA